MVDRKGNVDLDISRHGLRIHFTNTPKWAYILIAIGIMFALIIGAHALYTLDSRAEAVKKLTDRLINNEPLTDKDAEVLDSMSLEEEKELMRDIDKLTRLKADNMVFEQKPVHGISLTVIKDGEKTTITKGGTDE